MMLCVTAVENMALQVRAAPGAVNESVQSVVLVVVSVKTTLPADGMAAPVGTATRAAVKVTESLTLGEALEDASVTWVLAGLMTWVIGAGVPLPKSVSPL